MTSLNGFEVSVHPAGRGGEAEHSFARGDRYVVLPDRSEYFVRLSNHRDVRADADVKIDGGPVGQFVVFPHSSTDIERPADVAQKFTFFAESSQEARQAGISRGGYANGLISVVFKPEKAPQYVAVGRRALGGERASRGSFFGQTGNAAPAFEAPRRAASPQRSEKALQAQTSRSPRVETFSPANAAPAFETPRRAASPQLSERASHAQTGRGPRAESFSAVDTALEGGATLLGETSWQRFAEMPALRPDQIDQENVTEITLRLVAKRVRWATPIPSPYVSPYIDGDRPGLR